MAVVDEGHLPIVVHCNVVVMVADGHLASPVLLYEQRVRGAG